MDLADLAAMMNQHLADDTRKLQERREDVARTALAHGFIPEFGPPERTASNDGAGTIITQEVGYRPVDELPVAEGRTLFSEVSAALGVDAERFVTAWDAGKAWETWDHSTVSTLSMLAPFWRS